jgi:hypothetical protein
MASHDELRQRQWLEEEARETNTAVAGALATALAAAAEHASFAIGGNLAIQPHATAGHEGGEVAGGARRSTPTAGAEAARVGQRRSVPPITLIHEGGVLELPGASEGALRELAAAAEPALFGRGGESVLDARVRRARKLEPEAFAVTWSPAAAGILFDIRRLLMPAAAEARVAAALFRRSAAPPAAEGAGAFCRRIMEAPSL